jgi:DNA-binding winged helix-turn-helix (wHTH) protein/TolB-like protein
LEEFRLGSRTLQPHRQLLADGQRVALGKRALDILSVLAEARGEIVTKDELLEAVWPDVTVEENALQVHIVALRKALGPEADRLETIRGVGYRLNPDNSSEPVGALQDPAREPIAFDDSGEAVRSKTTKPAPQASLGRWLSRPRHLALGLAATVGLLFAAWAIIGGDLPSRSEERVPLVVRALVASGSGDPTEVALATGITDELIVRLRRIPELRVATARSDGSAPSEAFSSAYIVEGNIRSDGNQLRVTVRLTDDRGEIQWSQTFERRMADLFEVQEQIASNVANTLGVSLDVGVRSTAYGGTDNPEAYAAYVQGLVHLLDFDQTITQRHFERAIELDPDFVQAHANLAATYGNRIYTAASKAEADRMLAEMDSISARALKVNPELWIGNAARAWFEVTRKNLRPAEKLMRRVVELDEGNDPDLKDNLTQYWLTTGRNRKALAYDEAKSDIDPIHELAARTTFILMMNGRYDEAINLFDRLYANDKTGLQAFMFHVFWARILAGKEAEAMDFAQGLSMPNLAAAAEVVRTFDFREIGTMNLPQLRGWANERYGQGGQFQVGNLAFAAAYRGHDALAVNLLRIAFERPGGYALFYLWYPVLVETRKTDAFEDLVTDLGFVEVWRESGDWGDFCKPVSPDEIACQ